MGDDGRRNGVVNGAAEAAPGPSPARGRPLRGALLLTAGVFVFSAQDPIIKLVSGTYPITQASFIRSVAALPFLFAIVAWQAGLGALASRRPGLLVLRSVVLFCAYTSYYMALAAMQIADVVTVFFAVPLLITALAGPILGERVAGLQWVAAAIGFVGVVIAMRPGGDMQWAALFALLCALLYSLGALMARHLGTAEPGSVMAFYQNASYFLLPGLITLSCTSLGITGSSSPSLDFLVRPWQPLELRDLALMAACGPIAAAGTVLLTMAYREAETSLVAPFEYTGLVWAVLYGYLIWGDVPTLSTMLGAVLIIGAGLLALEVGRRRRQHSRTGAAATPAAESG